VEPSPILSSIFILLGQDVVIKERINQVLTVSLIENVKFEAECRGHKLIADQPTEDGGSDAGMSPLELFIASLGTCVGYYACVFCQRRKIATSGLKIKLDWEMADDPHRVGGIGVSISLPAKLADREKQGLMRTVKGCTIHNTLTHMPNIKVTLNTP
jgi:putative redox protein